MFSGQSKQSVIFVSAAQLEFVQILVIVVVMMVMVVVITCLLNHYRLSARSLLSRHAPTRRRHLPLANVSPHYVSAPGSVRVLCDKGVIYWINPAVSFQSELRFILLPLVDDSFLLCRMSLTGRFPFHCSQCKFSLCFLQEEMRGYDAYEQDLFTQNCVSFSGVHFTCTATTGESICILKYFL